MSKNNHPTIDDTSSFKDKQSSDSNKDLKAVEHEDRQQAGTDDAAISAEISEGGPTVPDDDISTTSKQKPASR